MGNRDEEDGKTFGKVCNFAHKGAREESKEAATVDGCNTTWFRKCFVEEGLSLCGYLLYVEITAEEGWFVGMQLPSTEDAIRIRFCVESRRLDHFFRFSLQTS